MRDLLYLIGAALLFDCIRLHYWKYNLKKRYAAMVVAALGPRVEVDGVMLPPYDDNWKLCVGENKKLRVGKVEVEHGGYIRVGGAIFMETTAAAKDYVNNVFKAYRARQAAQR